MRVEIKGRNVTVTDRMRTTIERRFEKVSRQVSSLAVLEVELCAERNPANPDACIAEGTLYLKGVTLRAKEASPDMDHSLVLIAEDLARQVKRHRDKRRARREAHSAAEAQRMGADAAPPMM